MYQQPGPQLFEDTSGQHFGAPFADPYANSGNSFAQPMYSPNAGNAPNFLNQQILLTAGQQILNNPMAAAALDQYGQNLVSKGKSWVGSNVRQIQSISLNLISDIFLKFTPKSVEILLRCRHVLCHQKIIAYILSVHT